MREAELQRPRRGVVWLFGVSNELALEVPRSVCSVSLCVQELCKKSNCYELNWNTNRTAEIISTYCDRLWNVDVLFWNIFGNARRKQKWIGFKLPKKILNGLIEQRFLASFQPSISFPVLNTLSYLNVWNFFLCYIQFLWLNTKWIIATRVWTIELNIY